MTSNPALGRLVVTDDLEKSLGISLQDMLNKTGPHALHIVDAWAEGNTDCAFAINNFVGVQRSHRDNNWNYDWVDLVSPSVGRGTYVYAPKDPYWVKDLIAPHVDTETIATVPVSNTTDTLITTSVKYTETSSQTAAITRAWEVGLKLTTDFHLFEHKFGLEASYNGSSFKANTKTTTSTTEFSAKLSYESRAVEDILKGAEKQIIKYEVDKVDVITKITLERVSASHDISSVIRKPD